MESHWETQLLLGHVNPRLALVVVKSRAWEELAVGVGI